MLNQWLMYNISTPTDDRKFNLTYQVRPSRGLDNLLRISSEGKVIINVISLMSISCDNE